MVFTPRRDKYGNILPGDLHKTYVANKEYLKNTKKCPQCKGTGKQKVSYDDGQTYEYATCFRCDGSKRVDKFI